MTTDILKQALKLYRKNLALLAGIALPAWILIVFMGSLLNRLAFVTAEDVNSSMSKTEMIQTGISSSLVIIIIFFSLFFVVAAGGIAISKRRLEQEIKAGSAYKNVLTMLFPLLGSILFSSVVIGFAFVLPNFLFPGAGIILGSYFYVQFNLVPQIVMLEGGGGIGAMRRAKRLISDYFMKSVLILVLPLLLQIILQLIIVVLIGSLLGQINSPALTTMIVALFMVIVGTLTEPIKMLSSTLWYYELRETKEGYDLEIMAKELAGEL